MLVSDADEERFLNEISTLQNTASSASVSFYKLTKFNFFQSPEMKEKLLKRNVPDLFLIYADARTLKVASAALVLVSV